MGLVESNFTRFVSRLGTTFTKYGIRPGKVSEILDENREFLSSKLLLQGKYQVTTGHGLTTVGMYESL